MKVYAVIDTNVIVSGLLKDTSVPGRILEHALVGEIIPLLNEEIVAEYEEVLRRDKFPFAERDIQILISDIWKRGYHLHPKAIEKDVIDPKDIVFYAVTMEARKNTDAYLVTGYIKHFPIKPYVVTPREMLTILERDSLK